MITWCTQFSDQECKEDDCCMTNKNYYPRGKLSEDDEGASAIVVSTTGNTVRIDFGKQVAWIGFDKKTALMLADALIQNANKIGTTQ